MACVSFSPLKPGTQCIDLVALTAHFLIRVGCLQVAGFGRLEVLLYFRIHGKQHPLAHTLFIWQLLESHELDEETCFALATDIARTNVLVDLDATIVARALLRTS